MCQSSSEQLSDCYSEDKIIKRVEEEDGGSKQVNECVNAVGSKQQLCNRAWKRGQQ